MSGCQYILKQGQRANQMCGKKTTKLDSTGRFCCSHRDKENTQVKEEKKKKERSPSDIKASTDLLEQLYEHSDQVEVEEEAEDDEEDDDEEDVNTKLHEYEQQELDGRYDSYESETEDYMDHLIEHLRQVSLLKDINQMRCGIKQAIQYLS